MHTVKTKAAVQWKKMVEKGLDFNCNCSTLFTTIESNIVEVWPFLRKFHFWHEGIILKKKSESNYYLILKASYLDTGRSSIFETKSKAEFRQEGHTSTLMKNVILVKIF